MAELHRFQGLEPKDPIVIGRDWSGHEVYDYEEVYVIEGELVLPDNLTEYAKETYKDHLMSGQEYCDSFKRL